MAHVSTLAYTQRESVVFLERNRGRVIFFNATRWLGEEPATSMLAVQFFTSLTLRSGGGLTMFVLTRSSIWSRQETGEVTDSDLDAIQESTDTLIHSEHT